MIESALENNITLEEIKSQLQAKDQELVQIKAENVYLKYELEKIKRMLFGSKSERFINTGTNQQLTLGLEGEPQAPVEVQEETISYQRKKAQDKKESVHSRAPLPSHLPRKDVVLEPDNLEEGAKKIGEEITEVLEYTPGLLYVKRYIRPKYALKREEKSIVIAELPSLPIAKGNAGASLISYITISKYVDHLPFYRQVQMFKRMNISIAESTINDWFKGGCQVLEPLYRELVKQIQGKNYLMADETPIAVLDKDKPGSTHQGYHWVYYSPPDKIVCFDYQKGRSKEGPQNFLKDFKGKLQTDGYSAYGIFEGSKDITLLACMAHVRRKFDESLKNDNARASYFLSEIQKLYTIERECKEKSYTDQERAGIRKIQSVPILDNMEQWLKKNIIEVLPKSPIGQAIAYTLSLWNRLIRYTQYGECQIDNNLIENSIRPVALGRKNYLFAGSHSGAERAAMMYSFLGTCKINQVNPSEWLTDVLNRINDHKANKLSELLPNNWKPL